MYMNFQNFVSYARLGNFIIIITLVFSKIVFQKCILNYTKLSESIFTCLKTELNAMNKTNHTFT